MLLLRRIGLGTTYLGDVLPAALVFGLGLAPRRSPIDGDRVAGLLAVATPPALAGLLVSHRPVVGAARPARARHCAVDGPPLHTAAGGQRE